MGSAAERRAAKKAAKLRKKAEEKERKAAARAAAAAAAPSGGSAVSAKSSVLPEALQLQQAADGAEWRGSAVEEEHVQRVYDSIASQWHGTRYKSWPRVAAFIQVTEHSSAVERCGSHVAISPAMLWSSNSAGGRLRPAPAEALADLRRRLRQRQEPARLRFWWHRL